MHPSAEQKKALIFGISGQDGAYLAHLLLAKGYAVFGTSRDAAGGHGNLIKLGIADQLAIRSLDMTDFTRLCKVFDEAAPDEIYNLAGQTSVGVSFDCPLETIESIAHSTLNLLECMRVRKTRARLFHACSAEIFGDTGRTPANETARLNPGSPYGVAKVAAHLQVAMYRRVYGLYACSGILFNHESALRTTRFVTAKIIQMVGAIGRGSNEPLKLGNIDVYRDWGWAPEYVEAMWLMLQAEAPDDFVIATGHSYSLREFIEIAFETVGKRSSEHLFADASLMRQTEREFSYADAGKIERVLGWSARSKMPDVVRLMLEADAREHAG